MVGAVIVSGQSSRPVTTYETLYQQHRYHYHVMDVSPRANVKSRSRTLSDESGQTPDVCSTSQSQTPNKVHFHLLGHQRSCTEIGSPCNNQSQTHCSQGFQRQSRPHQPSTETQVLGRERRQQPKNQPVETCQCETQQSPHPTATSGSIPPASASRKMTAVSEICCRG